MNRFVVTGTGRTGSATLGRALGFHESVAAGWEWGFKVPWARRVEACRRGLRGDFSLLADRERAQIEAAVTGATKWLGYKGIFRTNDKWLVTPAAGVTLFLDRFYETLRWWRSEPDIHVLHIVRTDNLAWLRSKFVATKLGMFGAGNRYPEDVSVEIPVHAAIKRVRMKVWLDEKLSELARTNPYCLIRYEDLARDLDAVTAKAHRFLGLEPQIMPRERVLERQSAGIPIEQHVRNYERLRDALRRASLLETPLPGGARGLVGV